MNKNMGEFEERPKLKEATPIPLRRRRPTGWIIATCVFAMISVALLSFIILDKNAARDDNEEPVVASEGNTEEEQNWDKKVDELVYELQTEISTTVLRAKEVKREKDATLVYTKLDSGVLVGLDHSQSVTIPANGDANDDIYADITKKQAAFDAKIVKILKDYDLELDEKISMIGYGSKFYYKNDDGLICQYASGIKPMTIACSHTSWLSQETQELAEKLIEAYKAKENSLPATLYINADNIKNGANGYQRVKGFSSGAAVLFYRKGEKGEWKFFEATQNSLFCESFDTAELKSAFAGEKCIDKSGNEKKVGE